MPIDRSKFRIKNSAEASPTENDNNSDSEQSIFQVVSVLRESQSLRQRPVGLSTTELALGIEKTPTANSCSYRSTKGLSNNQSNGIIGAEIDSILLGNTFAHETNKRDEDKEMLKYIEAEIKKRRGEDPVETDSPPKKIPTKNIDFLDEAVPAFLRPTLDDNPGAEGNTISQQMLSGIPEVDLGVESKMRNIVSTEEAKQRLIRRLHEERKQANSSKSDSTDKKLTESNRQKISSSTFASLVEDHCIGGGTIGSVEDDENTLDFVQHRRWNSSRNNVPGVPSHISRAAIVSSAEGDVVDPAVPALPADLHNCLESAKATDLWHLKRFKEHEHRKLKTRRR